MDSIKLENVTKKFFGTVALNKISFDLKKGEVHALVGQNGAGKSTLIKIITGVYNMDSGNYYVNGKLFNNINPETAKKLGISCIYQESIMVPFYSAAENIFLGIEPEKGIFLNKIIMEQKTKELLDRLDYVLDISQPVNRLSAVDHAIINICRALERGGQIIIFDEPTAALTTKEKNILFEIIKRLKKQNISIIYISHHLEEIFKVADRVTIMRDGLKINTIPINEVKIDEIIETMLGTKPKNQYPLKREKYFENTVLKINNLNYNNKIKNVNLDLKKGEILGVFGALGAGKTELAHLLFGLFKPDKGEILIENKLVKLQCPFQAIKNGIALIPSDRKREGLIGEFSISKNICLPILKRITKKSGLIDFNLMFNITESYINNLSISCSSLNSKVVNLSGGNQQKVVIGKWLAKNSKILIMDEPTQGIDVGAKRAIYDLIYELTEKNISVIFISSDPNEILGIADRIAVMKNGTIFKILHNLQGIKVDKLIQLAY